MPLDAESHSYVFRHALFQNPDFIVRAVDRLRQNSRHMLDGNLRLFLDQCNANNNGFLPKNCVTSRRTAGCFTQVIGHPNFFPIVSRILPMVSQNSLSPCRQKATSHGSPCVSGPLVGLTLWTRTQSVTVTVRSLGLLLTLRKRSKTAFAC